MSPTSPEHLSKLIAALRANAFRPEHTIAERRALMESATARAKLPDDVTIRAVDAGGRPGEWHEPADAIAGRAVLYLHGGGYVIGSVATHRGLASWLARATRTRVLTVDYRLAPEHPFPAAIVDAVATYRWLLGEGHEAGALAIAGDSAGGGLTVATLLTLREEGEPLPGAAVAISPWADLSLPAGSLDEPAARDPQVSRWMLEEMAGLYLGAADPRTPSASPRFADLRGLPPLLIHVAAADGLVDDAFALGRAAAVADVDVTVECWPNMLHVFHAFAPMLSEAGEALERIASWLDARLS